MEAASVQFVDSQTSDTAIIEGWWGKNECSTGVQTFTLNRRIMHDSVPILMIVSGNSLDNLTMVGHFVSSQTTQCEVLLNLGFEFEMP